MNLLSLIFNKFNRPRLYKKKQGDSQIHDLQKLLKGNPPENIRKQIQQKILNCQSGDEGENQMKDILLHSDIPMYILHDVFLIDKGIKAQIDLLAVTQNCIFVIECKNYHSPVRIDKSGQFIITKKDGSTEIIKSPVEQNNRHLKAIAHFFPGVAKYCIPVVVFTDSTPLNMQNAPQKIRQQIVKSSQLIQFIQNHFDSLPKLSIFKIKYYTYAFRKKHSTDSPDYTAKYKQLLHFPQKYLCPHCHHLVNKSEYGWFCSHKCGMKFDTVFGTPLSDKQVIALLTGNSTECKTKKGRTKVLPQIEQNIYQGKITFQWKTTLLG